MILRPLKRARLGAAVLGLCLGLALFFASPRANAAGEDAAIRDAVQQIMTEDYPGSLGPAKKKLQDQLGNCLKKGCGPAVKGEIYVALGMVSSQLGQADEAKQNFKSAASSDPNAKLPSNATPAMKAQFEEATGAGKEAAGAGEEEHPPQAEASRRPSS